MTPVCLCFQVHQPYRLRRYNYFDVGREHRYFDDDGNREILRRVAERSYRPAIAMLERLLDRHPRFAVSFSLSGCLLEQLQGGAPDVLEAFRRLASSGRAEFLAETSHHSLSFFVSRGEFAAQVELHGRMLAEAVGFKPRVFHHTEPIGSDALAAFLEENGYLGVLAHGVEPQTHARAPRHVYRAATRGGLPLLIRDFRLSKDIAFRFSDRSWSEWPLTAEKYDHWVSRVEGDLIPLFMELETFGEHQRQESGIFEFFEAWVERHLARRGGEFVTPSAAVARLPHRDLLSAPPTLSRADELRDVSAWPGNDLQRDALRRLFALEGRVKASDSPELLSDFRRLTTSDHFCHMAARSASDGRGNACFSPYESPYEAYIALMHVLADLERRLPRPPSRRSALTGPARPAPRA